MSSRHIINHIIALIAALAAVGAHAAYGAEPSVSPKFEMRAAWIATAYGIDWPTQQGADAATAAKQQKELDRLLKSLADAGFNAVFFQVRPMSDAFYDSSLEPWSHHLTGKRGKRPCYDPLAVCVARAHELGMECHAWINPFRVDPKRTVTKADKPLARLQVTFRSGKKTATMLNPALPETRKHICSVVREIAGNYDIDGIVFDDYFYAPDFIPEDKSASDWEQYKNSGSGLSIGDWRRNNVNQTIKEVYGTLSKIKEGKIRFGVSPQGIAGGNGIHSDRGIPNLTAYGVTTADSQYDKIYCDPIEWLLSGTVDYISPQIYWTTDNPRHPYGGLSRWWNDVAEQCGRHCFPSITISRFARDNSPVQWEEALKQIVLNRSFSFNYAPGTAVYSAACISGHKSRGFGEKLASGLFAHHALVPPMTWKKSSSPADISGLHIKGNVLHWNALTDCRYVVYAIPSTTDLLNAFAESGDGFAQEYIVGLTYTNSFAMPDRYAKGYRIAVAPYDRYGIEWQPVFLN